MQKKKNNNKSSSNFLFSLSFNLTENMKWKGSQTVSIQVAITEV